MDLDTEGKFICSKGHINTMCHSRYWDGDIWDECFECGERLGPKYRKTFKEYHG